MDIKTAIQELNDVEDKLTTIKTALSEADAEKYEDVIDHLEEAMGYVNQAIRTLT